MKNITVLGSTGSIGVQTLEVVRDNPGLFKICGLSANRNWEKLVDQAKEFSPKYVCLSDEAAYVQAKNSLEGSDVEVLFDSEGLRTLAEDPDSEIVLTAMVGFSGLDPTVRAIRAGKNIALANKETLVVGGNLITGLCKEYGVEMIPVDSEHSAIFQCLVGEKRNELRRIILTASGGPFRGFDSKMISEVTPEKALKHPNWDMGAKITIDSASLMNKGLEAIEAKWLFDLESDEIEIVVHPQSIIHSMVEFKDGSIKAQLGKPDMRLPIQYALAYPERIQGNYADMSFGNPFQLDFEPPDIKTFRNLDLAFEAMKKGGNLPCVLNASNEIAVEGFLGGKISFPGISDLIEKCMEKIEFQANPNLEDLFETDAETRELAKEFIR